MRWLAGVLFLAACGGSTAREPDCFYDHIAWPVGFQCSFATHECEAASATIRWTLNDQCVDGLGVQARFFDMTNGGLWPDASNAWATNVEGGYVDEVLACIPGAKVCYGAEPAPSNGRYWGLSLDGTQSCDACCAICGQGNPQPINLICN